MGLNASIIGEIDIKNGYAIIISKTIDDPIVFVFIITVEVKGGIELLYHIINWGE